MTDFDDAFDHLKELRRALVEQYAAQAGDEDTLERIARVQTAITAVEAVMAEPTHARTGPKIEFGEDGYPK
ncbi:MULTISPECIES: hypothetical protein [unclassified Mesorhizobium]|uniref:hypothetical protein n=1 Tax=unclassified Mesorhizobium TaxID=325217 RepID=UPI00112A7546|nr:MULTISPECIES: hypothetical protein [unclassified Mesorhizobium]TPJ47246.1 hypothetical protein FJ437_10110 [Mesorhizobium sp. B2-6-6]MBZ9999647.1 hypothetical protein [Mesorhizobium sp. B264B2A]MCA0008121.1 hypothetical protein [Mesorhizobium sp. B264B1B]MCA0018005.1 hypothetical protein [Mesorhizobium sp. B264B1A]TPJ55949.1 hypothetical protein FJ462_32855 [Mesorhizobium sp. B2-6-7]